MEARLVDDLPEEPGWQFEPKWDGFRCLAFRAGIAIELRAKSGKPLARYFPEMTAALRGVAPDRFVLDGELVIPTGDTFSFDALQMRLHPAESRIKKLAAETPAVLIAFDLLATPGGETLLQTPLLERRGALDGVIAKLLDASYHPGERAMLKVKKRRSADCVVGGFRYERNSRLVGSLLLGLYNSGGKLDHVGFTATLYDLDRKALTEQLEALIGPPGFTGNAPGGPSRWSTERSKEWQPLRPELVAEVRYDHVSGGRFRHGTRLLRWRPDKAPRQCTFEQIEPPAPMAPESAAAAAAGGSRRSRHT
jgi:ATP-dependent DNA ligase